MRNCTPLLLAAFAIGACAPALAQNAAAPASRTVELKTGAGAAAGTVQLTAAPTGVLMRVEARGLTPGWHGIHLHEKGDCSNADFTSAGGHINHASKKPHGLLNPQGPDMGDLPNIHAGADGVARAELFTTLTTVAAMTDADGSAVVIHVNADDQVSQPIGGAGARVACGVVK